MRELRQRRMTRFGTAVGRRRLDAEAAPFPASLCGAVRGDAVPFRRKAAAHLGACCRRAAASRGRMLLACREPWRRSYRRADRRREAGARTRRPAVGLVVERGDDRMGDVRFTGQIVLLDDVAQRLRLLQSSSERASEHSGAAAPTSDGSERTGQSKLCSDPSLSIRSGAPVHGTNVTFTGSVNVFSFLSSTALTKSSTAVPRAPA
jgi:hypothetical protein